MKILFLLTQDLESPSGIGRYFPLSRSLARLGHEICIVALHSNYESLTETHIVKNGVEIKYAGQMHVKKVGDQKIYFSSARLILLGLHSTWALTRSALKIPADIIHIGKPHPMNSIAGLIARFFRHGCIFLDCDDYEAASGNFTAGWQRTLITFFEDFIPKWVHHITTHTNFLRQRLLNLGIPEKKITYLPSGVDEERFSSLEPAKIHQLRMDLCLENKQIVAFIGSLSQPSHPVDLLFESFRMVNQSLPESILLIVGGGDQIDILRDKAQEMGLTSQIRFTGRVPSDQVPIYYRLADVCIDPVYDDPIAQGRLPLKMLESWISGVPFVTGDVGDRRAWFGDPPAGLLAQAGDSTSFANCILNILTDPGLSAVLQKRGHNRAHSFAWDRIAGELSETYQRVHDSKAIPHP